MSLLASTSPLPRLARALLAITVGLVLALTWVTASARGASSPVGYDLSYPQCEAPPPLSTSFIIVGVNDGLANNANPCLVEQLMLASAAPGLARPAQPGLSLYLNAADPGPSVADWPLPATGSPSAGTPYGTCDGGWTRACAYLYATQRAGYSYGLALTAAPGRTATAPWWIDVEIDASWANRSSSREWAGLNIAALRGYAAGLRAAGARGRVGLYSDAYQWRAITGLGERASKSYFPSSEHDWVTGARTLAQARHACASPFTGSVVTLAQFTEGPNDRDYACPPSSRRARR